MHDRFSGRFSLKTAKAEFFPSEMLFLLSNDVKALKVLHWRCCISRQMTD